MIKCHTFPKVEFLGEASEQTCTSPFYTKTAVSTFEIRSCQEKMMSSYKFKQLEQRWSRPILAQAANSTKNETWANEQSGGSKLAWCYWKGKLDPQTLLRSWRTHPFQIRHVCPTHDACSSSTHTQIHAHTQECVPPTPTGHSVDVDSGVRQITPRPTLLETWKPHISQPHKLSRARGIERKKEWTNQTLTTDANWSFLHMLDHFMHACRPLLPEWQIASYRPPISLVTDGPVEFEK